MSVLNPDDLALSDALISVAHRGTFKDAPLRGPLPIGFSLLVLALASLPPSEDLARGESEFLRGNAHCEAREFAEALACYERAASSGYEDHVMWNNRGVALDGLARHEEAIEDRK